MGAETNQKLRRKNQISAGKEYSKNRRAVNKKTAGRNAAGCCVFLPLQELLKESIYRADEMLLADKLRPACMLCLALSGLLFIELFFKLLDLFGQLQTLPRPAGGTNKSNAGAGDEKQICPAMCGTPTRLRMNNKRQHGYQKTNAYQVFHNPYQLVILIHI
jgi:hypothetical protein